VGCAFLYVLLPSPARPSLQSREQKVKKSAISLTLPQRDVYGAEPVISGVKSTQGAEGRKVMMEEKV